MPGGRLPKTENKRVCHISGLTSGRGRPKYRRSGQFKKVVLKQYLIEKQNDYFQRAPVAFKMSLTGSGRHERVDCVTSVDGIKPDY